MPNHGYRRRVFATTNTLFNRIRITLYERKEIKDLLAYLRLLVNPLDNYSFKRIINVPKQYQSSNRKPS